MSAEGTSGRGGRAKSGNNSTLGKLASLLPKEAIGKALAGVPGFEQLAEMMQGGTTVATAATANSTAGAKKPRTRKTSVRRSKKQTDA